MGESFSDLPDGRAICMECVSTVILDSAEARPLYEDILVFMERVLGLAIPPGMREIPILAVDLPSLNEQRSNGQVNHSTSVTRGLTLSTRAEVRHMAAGQMVWDPRSGFVSQGPPRIFRTDEVRDVTAILVLFGLPKDLTASILAHEALHAWLKLKKDFPFHLPSEVEEGMCQVLADQYLEYLEKTGSSATMSGARGGRSAGSLEREDAEVRRKESKLRRFFRHSIATDRSPVYGDGFRAAKKCVDEVGLDVVFEHIRDHKRLPDV
jgi:Protein DA1